MATGALLFDFGGTLDGPGDPWLDRFVRAYARSRVSIQADALQAAFGHSTRQCYADDSVRACGLEETVARHVRWQFEFLDIAHPAAADAIVTEFVRTTRASLAGSRTLLERWQPRARLGVVSNFYGNVSRILDEAGLAPLLHAIVDSTVVGVAKPDQRIFTIALDRVACSPAEAWFVGDSLAKDIAGARAVGMRAAWLAGARRAASDAGAADAILATLEDVEGLI